MQDIISTEEADSQAEPLRHLTPEELLEVSGGPQIENDVQGP